MRKLDLRSGTPVWLSYKSPKLVEENLTRNISTDVLIIGMGISGAMAADLLTEAGHNVVLIDRRGATRGSTSATTALIMSEIDVPLTHLSRMIGADMALRAWRRSRLAVANLQERIFELKIACDMETRPTLYVAGNVLMHAALRKESQARSSAGLSARYLTSSELKAGFGIGRAGAILSHGNLTLNPIKLTAGLLSHARARGAKFYAPEEAVEIRHGRNAVHVLSKSGYEIRARHIILATGYELLSPVKDDRHEVISTWVIATSPQKSKLLWPTQALIWEASEPYLYMRTTHDGRIICGGEDMEFQDEERRDALLENKTRRISSKLKKLHPRIDAEPEFAWTGSFGTTKTGLPLIGPLPGKPRLFAIMGYGGNGITFSRIAAELARTHLSGRRDVDADIFRL